jgi:hypothetical protein
LPLLALSHGSGCLLASLWPAADTAGRERLWQTVNVLGKVKDHLSHIVSDGKLAKRQLSELIHRPPT